MGKNYVLTTLVASFLFTAASTAQTVEHKKLARSASSPVANPPQFIVLGSDDNTCTQSMIWMTEVLNSGTNKDGSQRFMSFYVNTGAGGGSWANTQGLSDAVVAAYNSGHSISNHTHTHRRFVGTNSNPGAHNTRSSLRQVYDEMLNAEERIVEAGIPREHIFGFRTPFLAYSDSVFTAIRRIGLLYDCSIESGWDTRPGTHSWPYTLDIIPGEQEAETSGNVAWDNSHTRKYWSRPQTIGGRSIQNVVREHPGLWALIATTVEIAPEDRGTVVHPQGPTDFIISGLDWNIWADSSQWGLHLNEDQTVNILMHTLQESMNGNRAPFTFGVHSQYYFEPDNKFDWRKSNDIVIPGITAAQRRSAFERFVEQASQLENVWFVSSDMVIAWMKNPVPADQFNPADYHRSGPLGAIRPSPDESIDIDLIDQTSITAPLPRTSARNSSNVRIGAFRSGNLSLNVSAAGVYNVSIYGMDGKRLAHTAANLVQGANSLAIGQNLARGVAVVRVEGANANLQKRISIR